MSSQSSHPTLFDIHPLGTEPPIAQRVITPGCLLPAPEHHFVDAQRAADILDVSRNRIFTMLKSGVLRGYQLDESKQWKVLYESIVELCDKLRLRHNIADRRTRTLRPGSRWRDAELLPIPKEDTVTVEDAMTGLNTHRRMVEHLIEEGRFEAYQLYPSASWRISKTSLYAFAAEKSRQLARK